MLCILRQPNIFLGIYKMDPRLSHTCSHEGCGKKALFYCSRCTTTPYCSKECQALDWRKHKRVCVPPLPALPAAAAAAAAPGIVYALPKIGLLGGHAAWETVTSLCSLGPDSGLLASASRDKTVCIWRAATGERVRMLSGHEDVVRDVCTVSPELVASASDDKTVRVWDVGTGVCRLVLGHEYKVKCVCPLSKPDEPARLIASGSDSGIVKIWDVETGEPLQTFAIGEPGFHPQPISSICFVSDGFIAVSAYNYIYICNIETGEIVRTLRGHTSGVNGICLSSPGILASGASDETVRFWNLETGECIKTLLPDPARIYMSGVLRVCSVSPELLAAAKSNGTVQIWNKETGELVKTIGDDVVADYVWGLCSLGHGYIAYSQNNGIMGAKALPGAEGGRRSRRGSRSSRGSRDRTRRGSKGSRGKTRKSRKDDHKSRTRNKKRATRRKI